MTVGKAELYKESMAALDAVQTYDAKTLSRESELGRDLDFRDAVVPAQNLIDLFKRLSSSALQDFPDPSLTIVRDQANNIRKLFDQALTFSVVQNQNPVEQRNTILNNIRNAYNPSFQALLPFISYSLHRSADFQRLDSDARSTLQAIQDKSKDLTDRLAGYETDAKNVLNEIRNVAAEEGVTQQATHFRTESKNHEDAAEEWRKRTVKLSWGLGAFAFVSLFLHKVPWIKPETTMDAVQLSISKVLIFFVIAYMLFLSARNFLNHKHNAIVNKHRQNALMTHRALVEASGAEGVRDAVLIQAAGCIFSPQPTGYTTTESSGDNSSSKSVVEILSKTAASSVKNA